MEKLCIILISLLANSIVGYGKTDLVDLGRLIDICARQESILNIRSEYTFTISGPNVEKIDEGDLQLGGDQNSLLVAEKPFNKKFMIIQAQRLEDIRKNPFEFYIWKVYSNRIYKELQISDQNNIPVGLIAKETPPDMDINLTPLGFTIFHQWLGGEGRSLLDLLKGKDPNLVFSLNPVVNRINDCDTIELTCSREWIAKKMIKLMAIHFSLDHNYSVVRISYYNAGGIILEYNVRKFRPIGDGLWFPIECDIRGSEGDINKISVLDVQINQPFDEHVFELEFPPGTRVNDTITGKQYTIKPTQEQVDQVLEAP